MAVYVIADPHLSLQTQKPMDIFRGWDRHVERLEAAWTAAVRPGDTVILPGDISWAMRLEEAEADLRFLHELPGTKIIGKGNHDLWWPTMKKLTDFTAEKGLDSLRFLFNNAYAAEGIAICGTRGWFFDAENGDEKDKVILREAGRLRVSLEAARALGGTPVAFTHYPVAADGFCCEPLMRVLLEYGVSRCYFGHIHGDNRPQLRDFTVRGVRFSLISADYLKFVPQKVQIPQTE